MTMLLCTAFDSLRVYTEMECLHPRAIFEYTASGLLTGAVLESRLGDINLGLTTIPLNLYEFAAGYISD